MKRTVAEINERIRKGQAVVLTAEEVARLVKEKGLRKATAEVDVVTTGTFGPMCSSGAIVNTGHTKPRIKMQKAWFNDVEAYCGLAAVDCYLGATELPESDPENRVYPGAFPYGGAHVIQELVAGKDRRGTPRKPGGACFSCTLHRQSSLRTVAAIFSPLV